MATPSYDQRIEWQRKRPDECGGIRADCSRSSGGRPPCKSDETEQENGPIACGTGKDFGTPCTKYCNSFICVPRCPK
jgi:hypothetical protein